VTLLEENEYTPLLLTWRYPTKTYIVYCLDNFTILSHKKISANSPVLLFSILIKVTP